MRYELEKSLQSWTIKKKKGFSLDLFVCVDMRQFDAVHSCYHEANQLIC